MKRVILLFLVLICVLLTGCQKVEREERTVVTGTVTAQSHTPSYTTMMPIRSGKITTYIPLSHPATYCVTVSYKGVTQTFDNQELYESVHIGDTLQVVLYYGYNKDGKLIKETLLMPE